MIKNEIILAGLIFCLFLFTGCTSKNNIELKQNKCLGIRKDELLLQKVVMVPDIYRSIPDEKKGYRFLVFNNLNITRNYVLGYHDTLYIVNKNVTTNSERGTVIIDSVSYSNDSNSVELIVGYEIMSKFRATTSFMTFRFDQQLCDWDLIKKTTDSH